MKISSSRRWFLKALGLTAAAPAAMVRRKAKAAARRVVSAPTIGWTRGIESIEIPVVASPWVPAGTVYLVGRSLIGDPKVLGKIENLSVGDEEFEAIDRTADLSPGGFADLGPLTPEALLESAKKWGMYWPRRRRDGT